MKVHNIRLGHATNSSSSHSIIFDANIKARDYETDGFGWNFFTAASKEARDEYMAHMLYQNLDDTMSKPMIEAILRGLGLPDLDRSNYGIDHQSLHTLPHAFGTENVSIEFLNDFRKFMLKDGIIILGGNDNTEEEHDLYDSNKEVSFAGWGTEGERAVCRKDGDWWTLFFPFNGTRAVFSFEEFPAPFTPSAPMLMDIKITDFCTAGCAYCYQGSTPAGEHADSGQLSSLAWQLEQAGVFEVAIGGGEPTDHPGFLTFVKTLRRHGVVPNFTTRSHKWLENESFAKDALEACGAFAFSVDGSNWREAQRIVDVFKYRGYEMKKFNLQVIPAVVSEYDFGHILDFASTNGIRVTLLGYKDSGRGQKYRSIASNKRLWSENFDEEKWLSVLKTRQEKGQRVPSLSIDTTLASTHLEKLKETGIPEWLYHTQEGKYSMYLDAVKNQYGPSSYHHDLLKSCFSKSGAHAAKLTVEEMFSRITPV